MSDDKKSSSVYRDSIPNKRFSNQVDKNIPTDENKKPVKNTSNNDKANKK